jgi:hypothetical protein
MHLLLSWLQHTSMFRHKHPCVCPDDNPLHTGRPFPHQPMQPSPTGMRWPSSSCWRPCWMPQASCTELAALLAPSLPPSHLHVTLLEALHNEAGYLLQCYKGRLQSSHNTRHNPAQEKGAGRQAAQHLVQVWPAIDRGLICGKGGGVTGHRAHAANLPSSVSCPQVLTRPSH